MTTTEELRKLVEQTGLSQREVARQIGIDDRLFRKYCSPNDPEEAPKVVVLAIKFIIEDQRNDFPGVLK